jgi:hypothetical protein
MKTKSTLKETLLEVIAKHYKLDSSLIEELDDPVDTFLQNVRDVTQSRDPYANAVKKDGKLEEFTLKTHGSDNFFYCDYGCNVFHKPDKEDLDLYKCNACGYEYRAT